MNASCFFLMEAEAYLEMYDNAEEYSFLLEKDGAKEIPVESKKEGILGNAVQAIKNAVASLIKAVQDMIQGIGEFFSFQFLSADEKDRYRKFKAHMKEHPELAKKEINITYWKEYEKAYNDATADVDSAAQKGILDNQYIEKVKTTLTNKIKEIGGGVSKTGTRFTTAVTLLVAGEVADQNALSAKAIKAALDKEVVSLKRIENVLGDKEAAKFKKRVDNAAKDTLRHRFYVWAFRHKNNTFRKVIKNQWKTLLSFTNIKEDGSVKKGRRPVDTASILTGMAKHPNLTKMTLGDDKSLTQHAKTLVKTATAASAASLKATHAVRKGKRNVKKTYNFFTK